ncbi:hypothetical protein AB0N79_37095 [Streptomyces microflavus]|uniref:hypothetical protein n=1 Tax=Streptomyces microflavus TaxID=1919 RepID=UPI003435D943
MVDGLLDRCRTAGTAIRARVDPMVDTMLAAVDVAAVVFTVRRNFARRHVLAEARRHLLETLRGRAFTPGLDDDIANRALSEHGRQTTVPQPGRRAPATDQIFYTADFTAPGRWWIASTCGRPPRESSRYEWARVASLAVRNAIRAARTGAAGQDDAPAATSAAAHAVDHSGRDAALTPVQRADAVHAQQQAAMPEKYLGGRTTDPATWLRTPESLERFAAFTRAANARRRAIADGQGPTVDPGIPDDRHRQEHEQQHRPPGQDHGQGLQP